ncbi:hypothetical protein Neosp_009670 [[Neocosmospora] mangrovei]
MLNPATTVGKLGALPLPGSGHAFEICPEELDRKIRSELAGYIMSPAYQKV